MIIQPANIFLDSEGNIKIGDFGLATTSKQNLDPTNSDDNLFEQGIIFY